MPISPNGLKRYSAVPMNHTISFITLDSPQFLYLRVYFQDSVPRQEKVRFMYINYPQLSRIPTEGFDIS